MERGAGSGDWRRLARQVSLSRCLETVLAETHYADWLLTQPRGEQRRANVQRLLGLAQPQVSKHLRVLREVGAVEVRDEGRRRLYRLNGRALKPIHDWVKGYEDSWSERFDRLDGVLEELKQKEEQGDGDDE